MRAMQPVTVLNRVGTGQLMLTCEHASCAIPAEYANLGLDRTDIEDHIGWDIGAGQLTEVLAQRLDAPAVLAGISRLVIDCNRDLADDDLIVSESHGVRVPGNIPVDRAERARRVRDFYEPYHAMIDSALACQPQSFLLSVHSFTPSLNDRDRRFDVGVLFDTFAGDAQRVGATIADAGLAVRYNEPYSGLDGLIYSARTHGMQHGLRYLELEVNNRLLRTSEGVQHVAEALLRAVSRWGED